MGTFRQEGNAIRVTAAADFVSGEFIRVGPNTMGVTNGEGVAGDEMAVQIEGIVEEAVAAGFQGTIALDSVVSVDFATQEIITGAAGEPNATVTRLVPVGGVNTKAQIKLNRGNPAI